MRSPRASAVVVALSTFVAVAVVAAAVSQLTPLDRAGAALPDGPISVTGAPADQTPPPGATDDPSPTDVSGEDAGDSPAGPDADGATVVEPAPAATVDPDPTTPPVPEPAPTSPGNSASAPGQTSAPGNSGNAPGQNKP